MTKLETAAADKWAVYSYVEVGKRLGISAARVRQSEQRALRKLRRLLSHRGTARTSVMEDCAGKSNAALLLRKGANAD